MTKGRVVACVSSGVGGRWLPQGSSQVNNTLCVTQNLVAEKVLSTLCSEA